LIYSLILDELFVIPIITSINYSDIQCSIISMIATHKSSSTIKNATHHIITLKSLFHSIHPKVKCKIILLILFNHLNNANYL